MFDLVADVAKYPEFMPWCGGSTVRHHDENGMEASIVISIAGVRQSFATRNRHRYPDEIAFELVDGPFSELTGHWQFIPLGDDNQACKVVYTMQYAFSSRTLETIVGPIFNRIANSFIDSFTQRAQQVYG